MKALFIAALVLNLLTEGMAALVLITAPGSFFAEGQVDGVMWARNYGFAALAIASAGFWIWPYRENIKAVGTLLGVLLTFHIGIFISLVISGDQVPGVIAHAILSVLCVFLYTQRSKWCTE